MTIWNGMLGYVESVSGNGRRKFKTAALEVWDDIKTGWNENAGGGIAWKKISYTVKMPVPTAPPPFSRQDYINTRQRKR